jgi:hypothetical protein
MNVEKRENDIVGELQNQKTEQPMDTGPETTTTCVAQADLETSREYQTSSTGTTTAVPNPGHSIPREFDAGQHQTLSENVSLTALNTVIEDTGSKTLASLGGLFACLEEEVNKGHTWSLVWTNNPTAARNQRHIRARKSVQPFAVS